MNVTFYTRVVAGLNKSAALEEYLQTHTDPEILQTKTAHDQQLFAQIKEAINWGELASKVIAHPVGRGAAYGLGAAVPATAAGTLLIRQAGKESRQAIEDARNKALQTALGVGGIGAGLLALHRLTKPMQQQRSSQTNKTSSATNAHYLLEKLATVGFLDVLLEEQEKNADNRIQHDAHECRMLNAEHGIDLLRQLLR